MNITKIAIIGCGNLGRRHLQGAVKCTYPLDIYVYDINSAVFEFADEIIKNEEKNQNTVVNYITSMAQLPKELFAVVVASGAYERAELVRSLLAQSEVSYLILEKVLFQKYEDYDEIGILLKKRKVNTYVNCPRRCFELYNSLKKSLKDREFKVCISGENWGLACNFIHMLDIIAFLAGTDDLKVDISKLDDKVIESKRLGYKEITGTITGSVGNCKNFSVTSYADKDSEFTIYIETINERILIIEPAKNCYRIGDSTSWQMNKITFDILYQSELTNKYIESLIDTQSCALTPYSESALLHKAFIKPLTEYFANRGEKNGLCPIT